MWGESRAIPKAGFPCRLLCFPEQPHPGSTNLMAGFQWSSQDGEGERLERGERKQGNASEVRRAFFFLAGDALFCLPASSVLPFSGSWSAHKKMGSFSLLILAVAASAPRDPAAPPGRSGNGCEPRGWSSSRE